MSYDAGHTGFTPVLQFAVADNLDGYANAAHQTAVDKGWWDGDGDVVLKQVRNFGEVMANVHSECTEAWKEWVAGHELDETYYTLHAERLPQEEISGAVSQAALKFMRFHEYLSRDGSDYANTPPEPTAQEVALLVRVGVLEPHGVPTELADIMIRVLDLFAAYGLDADLVVQEKMAYNRTRKQRHGGKRA